MSHPPAPPNSATPTTNDSHNNDSHNNNNNNNNNKGNGGDATTPSLAPLKWSWALEHQDRERERKADQSASAADSIHHSGPFEVDRRVLKDVVREKMGGGLEVGRIEFLSSGTFHKAYLTTLTNRTQLVVRVARRFMPRLKTESEVATIEYLRKFTNVPLPRVLAYDSNPWNRLGGEYMIMDKAPGIPLAKVYHGLSYTELVGLLRNLATLIIPLFAHRFGGIGSLYLNSTTTTTNAPSKPKPKPNNNKPAPAPISIPHAPSFHIGPIISWPFFGSSRGLLTHPTEINRGPWSSTHHYLTTCSTREISSISQLENQGRINAHKLHLSPDEIRSSRYHRVRGPGVDGDVSDESDEWDLEESEEDEWEEGGWGAYRDYRRGVRGAFLVKVLKEREGRVRKEMERWEGVMNRLGEKMQVDLGLSGEDQACFTIDCHDLSLENIFVSPDDHTRITCVIDWEATTTRPLWAAAHLPSFLRSSVFVARLFRAVVEELGGLACDGDGDNEEELRERRREIEASIPEGYVSSLVDSSGTTTTTKLEALCREWLSYESSGAPLRLAHRCVEWDGWEEGLVDSILGPEPEVDHGIQVEEAEVVVEGHCNEGLVWGWGVQPHCANNEDVPMMANQLLVPPPSSRPPFLHLNSSFQMMTMKNKDDRKKKTTTNGLKSAELPLFPLVPLQVSSSSLNGKPSVNGNLCTYLNGTTTTTTTTATATAIATATATATASAPHPHPHPPHPKDKKPLLKNGMNPSPIPPPTASTQTAMMLSTQTAQAEKAMEKMLDGTGDICGGRGGELGRRLEAWLVRSGGGGAGVGER